MSSPQIHVRSISLPPRLNPTDYEVELKSLQICSTLPTTSETIQSGLVGLAQLYNSVDEFIELYSPTIQQDAKAMEESLSGSVELLDSCSIIRDHFQMVREKIQSLQSAVRRKGLADPSILQDDITTYFCFRKKMRKWIAKTLKTLENLQYKFGSNEDRNFTSELTGVTIAILKSIMVFSSLPMESPETWSFVSKLMPTKSMEITSGKENEVANVDFALKSLRRKLRSNGAEVVDEVQMMQRR